MTKNKEHIKNGEEKIVSEWQTSWDNGMFLQQAIFHSGIGFGLVSEEGIFLRANACLCRILGYNDNGLKGTPLVSLLHPENSKLFPGKPMYVEPGETSYRQEQVRCLQPDGKYRWFKASLCATRFGDDESLYYSLLLEDIHDSIQPVNSKEWEDSSIGENSPEVIVRYNMAGRCVYVNKQFTKFTGLDSADIIGHSFIETEASGNVFLKQFNQKLKQVLNSKDATVFEVKTLDKYEKTAYLQIKIVTEYDRDGNMLGVLGFGRNITLLKTTKVALWENQQLLQAVMDNIPQAIFWKSRDLVYLGCNRAFAEDAGLSSPADVVGKTDNDMPWQAQVEIYNADDLQVLGSGKAKINYEEPQTTPTGDQIWLRTSKIPMQDAKGNIAAVLGTYEDITERKLSEEKLYESEKRFRTLYNDTPALQYSIDREGKLVDVSDYWLAVMGYNREEVIGRKSTDFLTEKSRKYAKEVVLPEFMKTGSCFDIEYRYVKKSGEVIDCLLSATSEKDNDGKILRSLAVITDITKRKQMEIALALREREFRSLADNLPVNIVRCDAQGRYLYINQVHERTLGATFGEVAGKPIPASHEHVKVAITQVVATGKPIYAHRQLVMVDGNEELHDVSVVPEFDAEGRIASVLGIGIDMTERYRIQEALVAREQEFRSLAESSPDFVIRYDKEHRMRYLNGNLLHRLMIESVDDVLGKCPVEVWPDGRYAAIDKAAQQALENGGMVTIEMCVSNEKGEDDYLDIYVVPERNVQGEIIGTIAFGRDITKRKQGEREREQLLSKVQKSEELLHAVIDNMPSPVFLKDKEGHYLLVNSAFCEYLGKTEEELIGKTVFDLSTDKKLAAQYHKMDLALFRSKDVQIYESEVKYADGSLHQVMFRKAPFTTPDGEVGGLIGIMLDITGRKQAELGQERLLGEVQHSRNMLRTIIDSTPDWIFVKDRYHRYQLVNHGYANALHLETEDFIGKDDLELGFPEELVKGDPAKGIRGFWADDRLVFESGQAQTYPNDPATIDGEVHTFHTIKTPLRDADGQVWGVLGFARDITGVQKMKEQLELVSGALERVDTSVFISNGKGRFVYVNARACQALGYSRDELLSLAMPDIDAGRDNQAFVQWLTTSMEEGTSDTFSFQRLHINKNGRVFPVEVIVTMFRWKGRSRSILLVRDLSKQQQVDELLIRFEQDFMVLVEGSPDIIVRYDTSFKCMYVNQAWELLTGYAQFDMLDKTPSQIGYLSAEATRTMEGLLKQVVETGQAVRQEFMLPRALTGQPVYLLTDVVPERNLAGEISGIMVIARDVSEMKLNEEILRRRQALLEEAQLLGHIGSWEFDLVTGKREWSTELYRIFEMDQSGTLSSNETFTGLVHPADRGKVNDIYKRLGKELDKYEVEFRLLFPAGHVKYVVEKGISEIDDSGTPFRYLGTVQDITKRKEDELQLCSALEQAEESSRLKSVFLSIISHEIRTPLNAIYGFTTLLSDDSLKKEERDEFIQLVVKSIGKLTGMVDNLIDLSKIESGSVTINPIEYDPGKLLKDQFEQLKMQCRERRQEYLQINVAIEPKPKDKNFVNDATRIKQVLEILVNNALDFTNDGGIFLELKYENDRELVFRVSDTGVGIPKEKQELIFEPFTQVEEVKIRHHEGLGIGLSTARKLARTMGGDLTVVSEEGKGSTFSLTLPLAFSGSSENIQNPINRTTTS